MRERDDKGRFLNGHAQIGGMPKGGTLSESARKKISESLTGIFGVLSRAWKGDEASYFAKHQWIRKHYGRADRCENPNCTYKNPKRYEWANISGSYKRERSDYIMLCPSCHRKGDLNGGIEKWLGL